MTQIVSFRRMTKLSGIVALRLVMRSYIIITSFICVDNYSLHTCGNYKPYIQLVIMKITSQFIKSFYRRDFPHNPVRGLVLWQSPYE